jgi:acetylornithine deacetylase/succinyl-diaminopimelate desuccinylase-like protein
VLDPAELLARLVAVPSVNPLLAEPTGSDSECALADQVAGYLRAAGVETHLQEVKDGRCNVIGHLPRAGAADDVVILLTAHMDTYPAGGPQASYQPQRDGTLLYGRGSADAKGSLAAMLAAFTASADAPVRREAYLVATVDEECLLLGAKALASYPMRATLAITGEPTSLVPIVAQKGIVRGSFRVRGPRAHAAYPVPRTAITSMRDLVDAVARLNEDFAGQAGGGRLGHPTLTLTRVASDGGMNLAAREVTAWFDGRFLPTQTAEQFLAEITERLRGALGEVEFELDEITFVSPPNECPPAQPVLEEFFGAVRDVAGDCEPDVFSYGSEAGVLAGFSDMSLVFGPGDAHYSHGVVEVIDTRELEMATQILHRLLIGPAALARQVA